MYLTFAIAKKSRINTSQRRVSFHFLCHITGKFVINGFSAGLRHLNDYAATVIPFLFLSRLSTAIVAAVGVAVQIWTMYCRVPQSFFNAITVFLSYARGVSFTQAHKALPRLIKYSAAPSIILAIIVGCGSPIGAVLLGGSSIDIGLVVIFSVCYLIAVPVYLSENMEAEILMIEDQGTWISISSSLVTYFVTIPLGLLCIIKFHNAAGAILTAALTSFILTVIYGVKVKQIGWG